MDFIFLTKMLENIAEQTRRDRASPNGQAAPVIAQPKFTDAEVALLTRDGLLSGLVEVKDKRVDFKTWLAAERASGVTEDESTLRQRFATRAFLAWFPYAQRQVAEQPFYKFLTRDDTMQEFNKVREIIKDLEPREAQVLTLRFGLDGTKPKTLEAVSQCLSFSGEHTNPQWTLGQAAEELCFHRN